jgi:HPt (histidine-containing phosphotransfer) domain-containing protein
MPHPNPKVQKFEDDVRGALKSHGKKEKPTITRSALSAYADAQFAALEAAIAAGEPTLSEAVAHTKASKAAILDLIEAAS